MKKIAGMIALLLSILIFLIHRQLTGGTIKAPKQKMSVPSIVRENLALSALMFQ